MELELDTLILLLIVIVAVPLCSIVALKYVGKEKRSRRPVARYR